MERLKVAIQLLFETSRPDPTAKRPLFTDFAPRLLVSHPSEVKVAHAPLLALLTELMEDAARRRQAAAERQPEADGGDDDADRHVQRRAVQRRRRRRAAHPITADEVWDFCANGFAA